jgi:3-isopropylmalate/(R)-2-methylmalate dehydratase small subunit
MPLAKILKITARPVIVPGDDMDTDRIIPARFLKCITFDGLGAFAFADERKHPDGTLKDHPLNKPEAKGCGILVGGFNFGCGSSRDHAPQSILRAGYKAVIAGSFAEIFFGNSTGIGLPCVALSREHLAELAAWVAANPTQELTVDLVARTVVAGDNAKSWPATMADSARDGLINGKWDAIADLLDSGSAISETAARLPYVGVKA